MATASRAALELGASCSEAAQVLGAGMAAIGLRPTSQVVAAMQLVESVRIRARLLGLDPDDVVARASAAAISGGTFESHAEWLLDHEREIRSGRTFTPRIHGVRMIIDDPIEPAPTIDRMPYSGASADLVLRELGLEPRSPDPSFFLIAGKGTGKTEAMRQWLWSQADRENWRVVAMRDGKPIVLPSPP